MLKKPWVLGAIGAVAALVVLGVWLWSRGPASLIDLVEAFPEAEKRSLLGIGVAFDVVDTELAGDTKPSIFAHPTSRIIWRLRIPRQSELQAFVGLREQSWTSKGDGVQFRIGISHAGVYVEAVKLLVNPYSVLEDRRWIPVRVDLEPWSGEDVEVIFNTEPGPEGSNDASDFAVWGAPRIVPKGTRP